jgi:UDP-glucose:(heptosyl)LPS alpha-1,3-glucosyltransferase
MLARFLVARGHEVHVFGSLRTSDVSLVPGISFHDVPVPPKRETRLGLPRYVATFASRATRLVGQHRADLDVVHVRGECCLTPDIYHLTGIQWGERRRALATQGRVPVSRRAKNALYPLARPLHPLNALLERRMLRATTLSRIHVDSWFVKDDLVEHYGLDPDRVEVVPTPVDISVFCPGEGRDVVRRELGLPDGEPVLVFLGDNFRRKGLDRAITALSLMHERATLIVVGGGAHVSSAWGEKSIEPFRQLAEELHVADRVRFLGRRGDVPGVLRAADVMTLPTRSDMWAMAVLEAMATGLPTVISDAAGAARAVTDGIDGFVLTEPLDVKLLAARYDELARHPGRRTEMGIQARRRAHDFSVERVYGVVERAMSDVAAGLR